MLGMSTVMQLAKIRETISDRCNLIIHIEFLLLDIEKSFDTI